MTDRPTPETDAVKFRLGDSNHFAVHEVHARRLECERDEAREWQTMLSGWGGTPEIVHDFIKGQQMRIYAAQEAERERDEAREQLTAERALADRLASVMFGCTARDMNDAYDAWKEARK